MNTIHEITSANPGATVAIFGGVHGNEKVGILAVEQMLGSLSVQQGTVYLVLANPPAIKANVRQLGKNLNRCFFAGNNGMKPEDTRARELMTLLNTCDALLDIHSFNDPSGEPFVICEPNALEITRKFDVPLVSTNWSSGEPGATDGYMYENGKIGICLECGPTALANDYLSLAVNSAYKFLKHFGVIKGAPGPDSSVVQRKIEVKHTVVRTSVDFNLDTNLKSFQKLMSGQIYGQQDGMNFVAEENECIIFPRPNAALGTEAFVIGSEA